MRKLLIVFTLFLFTIPLICSCSCNPTPEGYYIVRYVIDGEQLYSAYAEREEIIGMPVLEEREGYIFKGWYLTDEYIEKWDFEHDTVKRNFTLYGYWVSENEETFNVLYYNNSKLINYEKVPKGNCASSYSPPDKKGYEFNGWLLNENQFDFGAPITDDIILNADFKVITYTISFISDNETVYTLEYTIEDKNVAIPEVPLKEHYTCKWTSFELNFEDTEVSAVYTPIQYIATFKDENNIVSEIKYTVEDTVVAPEVPQKAGYNAEWYGLPIAGGNVTIIAEYTPIVYTITYTADGVTIQTIEYTVENREITPPAIPDRLGFKGVWEEKEITFGDVTIDAIYTMRIYTATFIADDKIVGTCNFRLNNMNIEEPAIPPKDGYTAEWEEYSLNYEDITIKAIYTPITYTADFLIGSEKVGTSNFTIEDNELQLPDIKEWQGYSIKWEEVEIVAQNLIVNAILTPITYYVTFIADGHEIAKVEYTVENKDITAPPPPQKVGYTAKWKDFILTYGNVTVNAEYTLIPDDELIFKDEFDYQTEDDGSLTVTGYYGKEKYLYIPSKHEDLPVKAIGKWAFKGSDITGIKLSEGIETIDDEAFVSSDNLTEVLLPESLKSIGRNAFTYCRFTEINLPDNISEIDEQAFACCPIKSITLPKNLTELKNIFYKCSDLESVILNENLTALRSKIFEGCSSLRNITIPTNVKLIEAKAFAETALESAVFEDTENWSICNADGVDIPNIDYSKLSDEATAAEWLTNSYSSRYWKNSKA